MKKKPNGYRYFCHLTGCLFGIFILAVLIINFLVPDRGFSQKENRVLASRPAISVSQLTSGKFADGYETYVNDQFFLVTGGSHCAPQPSVSLEIRKKTVFFLAKTVT